MGFADTLAESVNKGLPIIGRVHDIDMKRSWFKFKEWGDEYGPIYQTTMMGKTHIWISSHEIATELLAKRGAIYSDRPGIPHMPGTKDGVEYLPFLKYGGRLFFLATSSISSDHIADIWRRQRKFGHTILQRAYAAGYHGHISSETHRFLADLLHFSKDYSRVVDRYLGRITCLLGWGTPDPVLAVSNNAYTFMYSLSPAGPLANALPALMWFPEWIVRSKKMEQHRQSEEERLFTELLERATRDAGAGTGSPCYSSTLVEKRPGFAKREAAYTVGMMANVAILTTGSPLRTFLLAMVLHQHWQAALRAEIDVVLGEEDRLLGLGDAPSVPLLRAVIKECFRWRPVIPTGKDARLERGTTAADLGSRNTP
jgi:cytochrome P450